MFITQINLNTMYWANVGILRPNQNRMLVVFSVTLQKALTIAPFFYTRFYFVMNY